MNPETEFHGLCTRMNASSHEVRRVSLVMGFSATDFARGYLHVNVMNMAVRLNTYGMGLGSMNQFLLIPRLRFKPPRLPKENSLGQKNTPI
jgi:hypothetical protein